MNSSSLRCAKLQSNGCFIIPIPAELATVSKPRYNFLVMFREAFATERERGFL